MAKKWVEAQSTNSSPSDLTGSLSEAVRALYTGFVLRDVMAKVVPGAIVIGAVLIAVLPDGELTRPAMSALALQTLPKANLLLVVICAAISWLAGFALQGLGHKIGFVTMFNLGDDNPSTTGLRAGTRLQYEQWQQISRAFGERAPTSQRLAYERTVVIKEACGNAFLATSVSYFAVLIGTFPLWWQALPEYGLLHVAVILAAIGLYHQHRQSRLHGSDQLLAFARTSSVSLE